MIRSAMHGLVLLICILGTLAMDVADRNPTDDHSTGQDDRNDKCSTLPTYLSALYASFAIVPPNSTACEASSGNCENAIDGKMTTAWETTIDDEEMSLFINFSVPLPLLMGRIMCDNCLCNESTATSHSITMEFSNGTTQQAYENTNHTAPENVYGESWHVFHFVPVITTWVRMNFSAADCLGNLSVMEIQLFYIPGGTVGISVDHAVYDGGGGGSRLAGSDEGQGVTGDGRDGQQQGNGEPGSASTAPTGGRGDAQDTTPGERTIRGGSSSLGIIWGSGHQSVLFQVEGHGVVTMIRILVDTGDQCGDYANVTLTTDHTQGSNQDQLILTYDMYEFTSDVKWIAVPGDVLVWDVSSVTVKGTCANGQNLSILRAELYLDKSILLSPEYLRTRCNPSPLCKSIVEGRERSDKGTPGMEDNTSTNMSSAVTYKFHKEMNLNKIRIRQLNVSSEENYTDVIINIELANICRQVTLIPGANYWSSFGLYSGVETGSLRLETTDEATLNGLRIELYRWPDPIRTTTISATSSTSTPQPPTTTQTTEFPLPVSKSKYLAKMSIVQDFPAALSDPASAMYSSWQKDFQDMLEESLTLSLGRLFIGVSEISFSPGSVRTAYNLDTHGTNVLSGDRLNVVKSSVTNSFNSSGYVVDPNSFEFYDITNPAPEKSDPADLLLAGILGSVATLALMGAVIAGILIRNLVKKRQRGPENRRRSEPDVTNQSASSFIFPHANPRMLHGGAATQSASRWLATHSEDPNNNPVPGSSASSLMNYVPSVINGVQPEMGRGVGGERRRKESVEGSHLTVYNAPRESRLPRTTDVARDVGRNVQADRDVDAADRRRKESSQDGITLGVHRSESNYDFYHGDFDSPVNNGDVEEEVTMGDVQGSVRGYTRVINQDNSKPRFGRSFSREDIQPSYGLRRDFSQESDTSGFNTTFIAPEIQRGYIQEDTENTEQFSRSLQAPQRNHHRSDTTDAAGFSRTFNVRQLNRGFSQEDPPPGLPRRYSEDQDDSQPTGFSNQGFTRESQADIISTFAMEISSESGSSSSSKESTLVPGSEKDKGSSSSDVGVVYSSPVEGRNTSPQGSNSSPQGSTHQSLFSESPPPGIEIHPAPKTNTARHQLQKGQANVTVEIHRDPNTVTNTTQQQNGHENLTLDEQGVDTSHLQVNSGNSSKKSSRSSRKSSRKSSRIGSRRLRRELEAQESQGAEETMDDALSLYYMKNKKDEHEGNSHSLPTSRAHSQQHQQQDQQPADPYHRAPPHWLRVTPAGTWDWKSKEHQSNV